MVRRHGHVPWQTDGVDSRRWVNQGQPQTLVIACLLLYLNAVFALLDLLRIGGVSTLRPALLVYFAFRIGLGPLAGTGIAQERKWGYGLALAVAVFPFAFAFYLFGNPFAGDLITLIFEIALVALLLHPLSREYQKVWFK